MGATNDGEEAVAPHEIAACAGGRARDNRICGKARRFFEPFDTLRWHVALVFCVTPPAHNLLSVFHNSTHEAALLVWESAHYAHELLACWGISYPLFKGDKQQVSEKDVGIGEYVHLIEHHFAPST